MSKITINGVELSFELQEALNNSLGGMISALTFNETGFSKEMTLNYLARLKKLSKILDINHFADENKMVSDSEKPNNLKKLKLVDENCLYKPVVGYYKCIYDEFDSGCQREELNEVHGILIKLNGSTPFLVLDDEETANQCYEAERIEDCDYGDGGNYL